MAASDEFEWFEVDSRDGWRAWLAEHHGSSPGVWVVTHRKGSGGPVVPYDEIVEEALAFGWIDSKGGKVDERRTRLLLSPRRAGSGWSRPNKERIARLERDGRMTAAGRSLIDAAKADGSWTLLDDVEDLVVPDDLAEAFARHPGSRDAWEGSTRSVKRAALVEIVMAKRPETRARRVEQIAADAAGQSSAG